MKKSNDYVHDYVKTSIESYLSQEPSCDLELIKMVTHISGINPGGLADVFTEFEHSVSKDRYINLFNICRDSKFNCAEIK